MAVGVGGLHSSPWPDPDPKAQRDILQVLFLFLGFFFGDGRGGCGSAGSGGCSGGGWWCLFYGSLTSKQMPD